MFTYCTDKIKNAVLRVIWVPIAVMYGVTCTSSLSITFYFGKYQVSRKVGTLLHEHPYCTFHPDSSVVNILLCLQALSAPVCLSAFICTSLPDHGRGGWLQTARPQYALCLDSMAYSIKKRKTTKLSYTGILGFSFSKNFL